MKIKRYKKGSYRFYNINEKVELPSVTSILSLLPKPGLILWAVMNTISFLKKRGNLSKTSTSLGFVFHKKLLDSTAKEGSEIHDLVEAYALNRKESEHNAVTRYKKFESESGFICEKIEETLWDTGLLRAAGTADLIGKCSDIAIVFDIKTAKQIRLSHKIQAAVYKALYCLKNGLDFDSVKSGVLLIPRDKVRVYDYYINTKEEEDTYLEIFKVLRNLFDLLVKVGDIDLNKK